MNTAPFLDEFSKLARFRDRIGDMKVRVKLSKKDVRDVTCVTTAKDSVILLVEKPKMSWKEKLWDKTASILAFVLVFSLLVAGAGGSLLLLIKVAFALGRVL